jgi:hypothetical protein
LFSFSDPEFVAKVFVASHFPKSCSEGTASYMSREELVDHGSTQIRPDHWVGPGGLG